MTAAEASFLDKVAVFNGVDGETGGYLFPAVSLAELGRQALGIEEEPSYLRELTRRRRRALRPELGPKEGVDSRDLAQAGWGIVFSEGCPARIQEALGPLVEHRRLQASCVDPRRFRVLAGDKGHRAGEEKGAFLARHGVGPGPADPDRMPYYLLLVGGPEDIPYRFQYQLDVQYAVGRVAFDAPDDYRRYAETVVAAETRGPSPPPRVVLFGVRSPEDFATELTHDHLVIPLGDALRDTRSGWQVETIDRGTATKTRLLELLAREPPAVLLTASHGLGFPPQHHLQRELQGALLCQEWPGPSSPDRRPRREHFVGGLDITEEARPFGLISFHIACYGGGTPRTNSFFHRGGQERATLTEIPFVARLPQRLLAHPAGGALAVVAHVDRAWTLSFTWPGVGREIEVFASALRALLEGYPVGAALEYWGQRHAELASDLQDLRERSDRGEAIDPRRVALYWTADNDARNYVLLGDPAVRASPHPNL